MNLDLPSHGPRSGRKKWGESPVVRQIMHKYSDQSVGTLKILNNRY